MKRRGLAIAPEIAVGDGALGFWKALDEVWPGTRHQSCWVHKTANVLNKAPNSVQLAMKADLREVHSAPDRATAEKAISVFAEKYEAKYAKAVECLTKDRQTLLAFFDFPASTGTTCEPRTRSKACSPPCATGPCAPVARCRRCPVPRRNRGHRSRRNPRRLITSSPKFQHSSCRAAAARFGVAPSTAIRWHDQRRRQGHCSPKLQGGGTRSSRIEANPERIMALHEARRTSHLANCAKSLPASA